MGEEFLTQKQVFSVTQITDIIKEILQSTFASITIEGEISNFRPSSAGHIYFKLKDENAQIDAVLFRGAAYKLSFRPKDGDKVRCTGSISVYAKTGSYQIIVNTMEPVGSGNLLQMLEDRKKKLAAEGLFDENHKKPIPFFPKTIGVVTSPTGAAVRDIIRITKRRNKNVNIKILPAIVQGDGAAPTIVKMIELANYYKLCDVLIVGRGGGSLEDLLPFSEESVVRAVYNSEIPVISAVGHEIDWAICDYAADKRASTPSAAAELAVPELTEILNEIEIQKQQLYTTIKQKVNNIRLMIKSYNPQDFEIRFRTIQQPLLNRYEKAKDALIQNLTDKIKDYKNQIAQSKLVLQQASPQTILNRGYSMVTDSNGKIIRSSDQVKIDDELIITPSKGQITAKVNNIK